MYEQVETGPNYDKTVRLMCSYRSVAARMQNAKRSTQSKLDKRLEKLSEQITEALGELTDSEFMALDCWRSSIVPETYEVDHEAITARPYVSIRRVSRTVEEYDIAERKQLIKQSTKADPERDKKISAQLRKFLDTY